MASSGRPSCATASARRSVPVEWSPRVISARTPWAWAACSTRASSVAMQTCAAPERAARSAVRTTMGLPAMSARGLSGRRVEAVRAGIRAMKLTADGSAGGGVVERARLALQHDGNAVAHREGQPVGAADQLGVLPVMFEAALAQGQTRMSRRRDSMSGILKQFGGRQAGGRGEKPDARQVAARRIVAAGIGANPFNC